MWSAERDFAVEVLCCASPRANRFCSPLRPIYRHASVYIISQMMLRALFSNDGVDVGPSRRFSK